MSIILYIKEKNRPGKRRNPYHENRLRNQGGAGARDRSEQQPLPVLTESRHPAADHRPVAQRPDHLHHRRRVEQGASLPETLYGHRCGAAGSARRAADHAGYHPQYPGAARVHQGRDAPRRRRLRRRPQPADRLRQRPHARTAALREAELVPRHPLRGRGSPRHRPRFIADLSGGTHAAASRRLFRRRRDAGPPDSGGFMGQRGGTPRPAGESRYAPLFPLGP